MLIDCRKFISRIRIDRDGFIPALANVHKAKQRRSSREQDSKTRMAEFAVSVAIFSILMIDTANLRGSQLSHGNSPVMARIEVVAPLVIHVFTGMRDEEVSALQYSCPQTTRRGGKDHFVLVEYTTKLNHGRAKTVRCVTKERAVDG